MQRPMSGMLTGFLASLFSVTGCLGAVGQELGTGELDARVAAVGRPRLFLQQEGLVRLREQIATTHRERWLKLRQAVEASLDRRPPDYRPPRVGGDSTRPGTLNDEMLWQREFGYRLPGMALVALLDPDPRFFELARAWALAPGSYPQWGAGIYENTGLAAKHQLFGVSIAYDLLYDRWSAEDRASLQKTLRDHGRILYEAAEGINDRGWWKQEWRQNHAWNGYQALAVTAIALAGEEPAAGTWLAKALWGGRHIVAELPDEGAYEEGLPYWGYGMEALVRLIEAVRPYAADDFYRFPYFRNTPLFRLYLAGPRLEEIANFGDGRTTDWHAVRPMMWLLAARYRDPLTQWLAGQLPDRDDIDATFWSLLWFDPSVPAARPAGQPLSHVFRETGFAGARSSWNDGALTLHLRSGRADVSHSHLDVNNFLLNVDGEWLLRDYGYGKVGPGYFNKSTIYFSTGTWGHNCLVIGERHQRRDRDSVGVITDAVDDGRMAWWRSDATTCYTGAESVSREIVLIRSTADATAPGVVVIRDLARTRQPTTFDFMLQPGGPVEIKDHRTFEIRGSNTRLDGTVLLPAQVTMAAGPGWGDNMNVDDPLSLRISAAAPVREVEFVVVLAPVAAEQPGPAVSGTGHTVQVGRTELRLAPDGRSRPQLVP